jgi:hypothetical protein
LHSNLRFSPLAGDEFQLSRYDITLKEFVRRSCGLSLSTRTDLCSKGGDSPEDSVQGRRCGDGDGAATVRRRHLPALFDWSIIGWTILRLALMNLKQRGGISCDATWADRRRVAVVLASVGPVSVHQNRAGANAFRHRKWLGFLASDWWRFRRKCTQRARTTLARRNCVKTERTEIDAAYFLLFYE